MLPRFLAVAAATLVSPVIAQGQTLSACSLLTRAEVRELMPWPAILDQIENEEDTFPQGSGCTYPVVYVQVMSQSPSQWKSWVDSLKNPTVEPVAGVGEEAYIRDNGGRFAELYAKVGAHTITIQKDLEDGETVQAVKPQMIALAKALAAKAK